MLHSGCVKRHQKFRDFVISWVYLWVYWERKARKTAWILAFLDQGQVNTVSKLHVVRLSSPRDNFLSQDNSIRITTPQDFGSEEFFWLFVKSWGKFRNWRFAWDWRISNMSAAWRTESAAAPLTYWLNCPASSMSARIIFWWAASQAKRKSKMIFWALFRSCHWLCPW